MSGLYINDKDPAQRGARVHFRFCNFQFRDWVREVRDFVAVVRHFCSPLGEQLHRITVKVSLFATELTVPPVSSVELGRGVGNLRCLDPRATLGDGRLQKQVACPVVPQEL